MSDNSYMNNGMTPQKSRGVLQELDSNKKLNNVFNINSNFRGQPPQAQTQQQQAKDISAQFNSSSAKNRCNSFDTRDKENVIKNNSVLYYNNTNTNTNSSMHYHEKKIEVETKKSYNSQASNKKLIIPKNLNIKDEQQPFFSDQQNVQTQFSELKTRIEKSNEEKVVLAQKNEQLAYTLDKIQDEIKNKESGNILINQQLKQVFFRKS